MIVFVGVGMVVCVWMGVGTRSIHMCGRGHAITEAFSFKRISILMCPS